MPINPKNQRKPKPTNFKFHPHSQRDAPAKQTIYQLTACCEFPKQHQLELLLTPKVLCLAGRNPNTSSKHEPPQGPKKGPQS